MTGLIKLALTHLNGIESALKRTEVTAAVQARGIVGCATH